MNNVVSIFSLKEKFIFLYSFLLIAVCLPIILAINNQSNAPAQAIVQLKTVLDFVIVKAPSGNCVIYAIDGTASLYRHEQECGAAKISYSEFEKVTLKETVLPLQITALAYNNNTLYLADKGLKSILTVNLDSLKTRALINKSPSIVNPASLVISQSGKIVLGQDEPDNVLIFDAAAPEDVPRELKLEKDRDIYRVLFIGENLLIFNRQASEARIYFCQRIKGESGNYKIIRLELDENFESLFDRTDEQERDIAFINGYLYVTAGSSLWAWRIPNNLISEEEFYTGKDNLYFQKDSSRSPNLPRNAPDFIAVKERLSPFVGQNYTSNYQRISGINDLFVGADNKRNRFGIYSLMPVRISGSSKATNEILTKFYKAFFGDGLLPEREVTAAKAYDKFEDLLVEEKILLPENRAQSSNSNQSSDSSYRTDLNEILCKLAKRLTNWACDENQPDPVSRTLNRKINKGQALVVPNIKYTEIPDATEKINLSGRTVQEILESRFKEQNDLLSFSDERLMRNIAAYLNTFDYEMTQRGFIIRTRPIPDAEGKWDVGSLIKIDENKTEKLLSANSTCNIPESEKLIEEKSIRSLWRTMFTYDQGIDYLPGYPISSREIEDMQGEFRKMGISKLEVMFENPKVARISRTMLKSEALKSCLTTATNDKILFAADIFYADGAKYNLRTFKNDKILLTESQIKRWKLSGTTDAAREWSLTVDKPIVIAYRPIQWNGASLTVDPSETTPQQLISYTSFGPDPGYNWAPTIRSIKPGTTQDIRGKKDGTIQLPVKSGEVYLLVDSNMLALDDSPIKKLIEEYPNNIILPSKSTNPQAIVEKSFLADVPIDTVKKNRESLLQTINFPQIDSRRTYNETVVALMEENMQINHPDFFLDRTVSEEDPDNPGTIELVWLMGNSSDPKQRLRINLSEKPERKTGVDTPVFNGTDHGTHISGLLSSNFSDVCVFNPSATPEHYSLSSTIARPAAVIDNAKGVAATVFNFSQSVREDDQTNADLMDEKIKDNPDRLFVVAAGNGDKNKNPVDLNSGINIPAQVRWEEKNNNVLVVSAVDFSKHILKGGNNCGLSSPPPINYGWKYVHILAPGCNIYSSVSNAGYSPGSGTSQATAVVTAVAALLQQKNLKPQEIIARLIYTAKWEAEYDKLALGGMLDAGKALENLDKNVLVTETTNGVKEKQVFEAFKSAPDIKVTNYNVDAKLVKSAPTDLRPPQSIKMDDIYRITQNANNRFRVIYLDPRGDVPKLMILENAVLEGTVKYFYDSNGQQTTVRTVNISKFQDYTRKTGGIPQNVKFR